MNKEWEELLKLYYFCFDFYDGVYILRWSHFFVFCQSTQRNKKRVDLNLCFCSVFFIVLDWKNMAPIILSEQKIIMQIRSNSVFFYYVQFIYNYFNYYHSSSLSFLLLKFNQHKSLSLLFMFVVSPAEWFSIVRVILLGSSLY